MQIEMYKPDVLNLNEFIEFYDLNMILNNNLVRQDNFYFELENHDELLNAFIEEVTANPEDWIDLEGVEPEDINDEIYNYCIENLEDEVYQWFIIPEKDIYYWEKYTNYRIYYSDELDLYLLAIDHWGMSWSFFFTTAERPENMRIKKYDEILLKNAAGASSSS